MNYHDGDSQMTIVENENENAITAKIEGLFTVDLFSNRTGDIFLNILNTPVCTYISSDGSSSPRGEEGRERRKYYRSNDIVSWCVIYIIH